jgi:hypothetical protein
MRLVPGCCVHRASVGELWPLLLLALSSRESMRRLLCKDYFLSQEYTESLTANTRCPWCNEPMTTVRPVFDLPSSVARQADDSACGPRPRQEVKFGGGGGSSPASQHQPAVRARSLSLTPPPASPEAVAPRRSGRTPGRASASWELMVGNGIGA